MKTSSIISAAIGALIGSGVACAVALKQQRDQGAKEDSEHKLTEQAYRIMLDDFPHFLSQFQTFSEEEIYQHQENITRIYALYSDRLLSPLYRMIHLYHCEQYEEYTEEEVRTYLDTMQNLLEIAETTYGFSLSELDDFKSFAEHPIPID